MKKLTLLFATIILLSLTSNIFAQGIPETINYQGIIKDAAGVVVPSGDYNLTFKLYDVQTGGSSIWSETKLISVVNGIINTQLGSVTPIPQAIFSAAAWLGITVAGGTELTPRTALTSVPFSIYSLNVPDGSITSTRIADNEVVKSVNGLKDNVNLVAGSNVTITPIGNNLTINAGGGGSSYHVSGPLNTSFANLTSTFSSMGNFLTFTKNNASSVIEVYLNSNVKGGVFAGGATGVQFEIRVDGNASSISNDGTVRFSDTEDFISIMAVFDFLPVGTHTVSVWAKTNSGTSTNVALDPGGWRGRILVKETY